jgi:hypothetical protein
MSLLLTATKGLIFRITHVENMRWIVEHGVHCRNSPLVDPNFIEIGNPDLISKRSNKTVPIPPGGTLSDYVPFYFTPYSPMLLNIKTGWSGIKQRHMSEIAILATSLPRLAQDGVPFVFTDRHAYLRTADDMFSSDLVALNRVDWKILQARDFKGDPNDPGKMERYQAEALVYQRLPVTSLLGIVCHGPVQQALIQSWATTAGAAIPIHVKPEWYH